MPSEVLRMKAGTEMVTTHHEKRDRKVNIS